MAPSSLTQLLLRHISTNPRHRHFHLLRRLCLFSSSASPPPETPTPTPNHTSLSARLSFVFDKIDEIEKDRADKDDALHRIRAWRQSKKLHQPPPPLTTTNSDDHADDGDGSAEKLGLGLGFDCNGGVGDGEKEKREIEVVHPWPEWVAFMERLVKQNYFDHRRVDENKIIHGLGEIDDSVDELKKFDEGVELGVDFTRDLKTVHLAMINFGKDRFDIFRSLSRQDIQILVGYGCPSTDKKVVFSSKLLRKHAHLDEGDVCSSCSLRNTCERAYLVTNKEDEARTIDLMRVLLAYGFDPINGYVENKSLLKQKSVKAVVRKLLHEVVRLSAVPIDPNLPPPLIKKRPPKVKQPPPPPKRRVGRDDIEMKKGDWLCQKCNFMNFAKNSVCLQCDAKRPKRQLLPGEWECPQEVNRDVPKPDLDSRLPRCSSVNSYTPCDFLNYRRNMTCFNCEHKRPPDGYVDNEAQGRQHRQPARLERVPDRDQVSNAWNFDFDDDESDGADVAAFEYADPHAMNEDRHLDSPPDENFGKPRGDGRVSRTSRFEEKEQSRSAGSKPNMGFNDFDDEDDDIDNYELDNQNRNERQQASAVNFSDVENEDYSESESDDGLVRFNRKGSASYPKTSKPSHRKGALPDNTEDDNDLDYGSDEDLPVHPKWKSSHVAGSGLRNRTSRDRSKQRSSDSDNDDDDDRLVFGNDNHRDKGFSHKQGRGNSRDFSKGRFRGGEQEDRLNYRENGYAHKQGRGNFRDSDKRGFSAGDGQHDHYISRQDRGSNRDSDDGGFRHGGEPNNRNRGRGGFRGRQEVRSVNANDFGAPSRGSGRSQRGSFDNGPGRGSGRNQKPNRPKERGGDRGRMSFVQTDNWSDRDNNERPSRQRR
ncbi:hypothetical protein KSS87_006393 [Heliosperma pusillum]|nr:hypothetical protein KSS87_006393 [Heliosperma pusillum]